MQEINARGTFLLTQACLPHLREADQAQVLRSHRRSISVRAGWARIRPTPSPSTP